MLLANGFAAKRGLRKARAAAAANQSYRAQGGGCRG
jgi:hypothetical protein